MSFWRFIKSRGNNLTFDRDTSSLNIIIDDANAFSTINVGGGLGTGVNPLADLSVDITTPVAVGDSWVIIDNTGAGSMQNITFSGAGTASFDGLPQGTNFLALDGITTLEIDYLGGSGNDLALTVTNVIPEPSTLLIWAFGLLGLGWYNRRKKR